MPFTEEQNTSKNNKIFNKVDYLLPVRNHGQPSTSYILCIVLYLFNAFHFPFN